MKFSVIIPCYNDYKFIERAIDSTKGIPDEDVEIIVIDDGSDLKTKEVLNKLRPKLSKLIQQENKGVSRARNIGIENASNDVIAVIDSDDYFENHFFKKAYDIITNNPEVKIVTSYSRRFNESGAIDVIKPSSAELVDFLKYNAAIGVMFRKSDWARCGGYDEKMLEGFEDWEFYIRLLKNGGRSYVIPEILFHYRLRENSRTKSANKFKTDLVYYIFEKHRPLYIDHIDDVIFHYMKRVEILENSEKKLRTKPEYKVGRFIINPLRKFKKLFKAISN